MDDTPQKNVLFEIRGIKKEFAGDFFALDGITLDINESETLLIAGSNGSGKTLFMRVLAGLTESSEGTITYHTDRQNIGLVFQDPDAQFVGETVEEDIAFGPSNRGFSKAEIKERVDMALEKTGLLEKRHIPPRRLSGGEKRRLAVAGILAMGCRVIIMDEPFANLDMTGVVQVLTIIQELKKDKVTLIILTHELEKVLAFADRLVILLKGRIREDGNPEEALDRLLPEYGVRDPRRSYTNIEDCTWLT
jgi:biotin transport system ATP-binding protein